MEARVVHEQSGQRTYVLVLKTGEEIIKSLVEFATTERISAAQITAIGALSDVELKYFNRKKRTMKPTLSMSRSKSPRFSETLRCRRREGRRCISTSSLAGGMGLRWLVISVKHTSDPHWR
jgi:hypothetical protein